jgi:hydrogenase/urease accessory protein HupE
MPASITLRVTTSTSDIWRRVARLLPALLLGLLLFVGALRGGSYAAVPREEFFVAVLWVLLIATALGLVPRHRLPRGAVVALVSLIGLAGGWRSG